MPTYEYHCPACKSTYDLRQGFDAETTHACEECGKGTAKRILSAPAVVFKGSGWYATDSRNKSVAVADSSSDSSSDSKSGDGKSGDSGSSNGKSGNDKSGDSGSSNGKSGDSKSSDSRSSAKTSTPEPSKSTGSSASTEAAAAS